MKAVLVFVCFALIFCSSTVAINLQEALRSEPQFSSFTQHLAGQNPELWALLGDNTTTNTYTVFATLNNGAYVNNTSSDDLTYQVVSGSYNISEFIALETLPTLLYSKELGNATSQGTAQVVALSNINSTESWVINGEALVTGPSVAARNGWVHGVSETILTPKINLTNIPEANTTLGKIIRKLDLVTAVLPPATFLIPTENNFAALFAKYPYYSNYLLGLNTTASRTNLQNIVNAHLIPQVLYPNDLAPYNISGPYPTLDSIESIRFDRTGNLSTKVIEVIDNANERFPITQPNVLAPNGVAHYIDGLIIPQNFQLTLEEVLNLAPTTEFFKALDAFKLTDTLLGLSDSTFFIPIGSANFTGATLEQLLLHVVPQVDAAFDGNYHHTLASLTTLNNRTQVVSLETETIYQVNTTIVLTTVKKVNGIPVTNLNAYPAKQNNTVYFIETVLELPGPPTNTLVNQHFSEFIQLVGFAGDNVAVNTSGVTIFAPTNDAVNSLQPGVLGYLTLANGSFYTEMVEAIIGNHIVENNILYEIPVAVNGTLFPTLNNNYPINITNNGAGRIVINGYATVANNSIPTQNGLIRPIDSVIIPTGLEFNLSSILIGLGNERFNNSADGYGSYNKFLDYLKVTGLLEQLSDKNEEYTIFAPTDEAFDQAVDNFAVVLNNATNPNTTIEVIEQLTTALNYHVIYNKDLANIVPMTNASFTYPVGVETNDTVVVDLVAPADNIKNYRVTLFTRTGINDNSTVNQGSGNLVLNTTTSYNQRIYGINRVLGIPVKASPTPAPSSDHHKGLTTAEWVLIGVGGAALGLILLLIVAGVVYYLLIRPKSGYRKIN